MIPHPLHTNGHIICVVDVETNGTDFDRHEAIEVCIIALDSNYQRRKDVLHYETLLQMERPQNSNLEAMMVNGKTLKDCEEYGLDRNTAADELIAWFDKIRARPDSRIIPLAHNWPFDSYFIRQWLGNKTFQFLFDSRFRDTMALAAAILDEKDLDFQKYPWNDIRLSTVARRLGLEPQRALHTAAGDAMLTLEVYHELLKRMNTNV